MNPGQEVTINVLDVTQLINYPVSANYSGRGSVCSQGFPQIGTKGPGISTPGARIAVVLRPASSARVPTPYPRDLCGRRGLLSSHVRSWAWSGFRERSEIDLMRVGLTGQAVGLFALTNIDDHLDRKRASQSEGLAAPARPAISASRPDHGEHRSFMSDGW